MKKIVGIIAALALASAVFADKPDLTTSVTKFEGNATFGEKVDLDKETHGMYNTTSATVEVKWASGGDVTKDHSKSLWGEIQVKSDEKKDGGAFAISADVKTAKIHFIDGDFFLNMNILKPNFEVGGLGYVLATDNGDNALAFGKAKAGDAAGTPNGFTLSLGVPIISFDIAFGDNGADATPAWKDAAGKKNYSFKAATTIKPIDGLEVAGGVAMSTTETKDKLAIGASAKYAYSLTDTLSLNPYVAFSMYDGKDQNLGAALLFKWGAEKQEPGFLALSGDMTIGNKCTNGFSVAFTKTLDKDPDDGKLTVAVFDNTLLGLVGEDAGKLSLAAKFTANTAAFGDGVIAAGAVYDNTFLSDSDLPIGFTAKVSFGLDLGKDENNMGISYMFKLTQKTLIENTELYASYEATPKLYADESKKKGTIDIGCKISL